MASANSDGPEKTLPALSNIGYFSDYYLAHRLDSGLAELYARWDAAEKQGEPTDRTRLRSLSAAFGRLRADAALTTPAGDALDTDRLDVALLPADGRGALLELHDAVLDALGWTPERGATVELTSGDKTLVVPVAHRCDTPTGVLLVALDTVFATDPAAVIASKTTPAGRLVEPLLVNGKAAAHTALEAAQLIFTADDSPSYVLLVSGGSITLLDRGRWGEGISLGANLDEAVARHDTRPKGELAAIAGLFSASAINPGDEAQSVLTGLLERANTESAGVSKELRHGIRRSVEVLANAIVADIRYRQRGAWTTVNPRDLTRQSLRYLYRIIVLLFAEARPELGILPSDDPDYQAGYSMARLRDTALVELQSDHARDARHLQRSLDVLFRLVNDGHAAEQTLGGEDARELTFPGLRSALFGSAACPLIDQAHLSDDVLQQVVANLCFTRENAGSRRQAVSYSTLGVNQLGAVYEGLMAYSGFLATEPLFEVDKDGDPDNGSWVIPVDRVDEFPEEAFLTEEALDGVTRRVQYEEGEFVFRLSSRDRQRSASYYTPEVLTELTVRHALDVLFEEHPAMRAADILEITVCEPALGSGAFLNEAIAQLAERYLKAAQEETGETIDADRYQLELQRAKAHFVVNQAYGLDLNQTAVELAEVSLWLSCMHAGLRAPWFGARLRRGNSLIGARRATYTPEDVERAVWKGKIPPPPADQPLDAIALGTPCGIHHFLVPGEGWGAACDATEIKALATDWADSVRAWRTKINAKPDAGQVERLARLARRVEELWKESSAEVTRFWQATRQHLDVWGTQTPPRGPLFGDEAIRDVLQNPRSATSRLRTLMDAWCSLWVWAPQHGSDLPSLNEWLTVAEQLTQIDEPWDSGVLFSDDRELPLPAGSSIDDIVAAHPWLSSVRDIAAAQSWFHWELEFAPVFARGGFSLVVGNPPWTKVSRTDTDVLLDAEPLWAIVGVPRDAEELAAGRARILSRPDVVDELLTEAALSEGLARLLGGRTRYPATFATITNLYQCFIEQTHRVVGGVSGLLHQEAFYEDSRAKDLRKEVLLRLRRHWHFVNELSLFEEVHNETEFGVHVSGSRQSVPRHLYAANLLHPSTVDRSLDRMARNDRSGELPGKKTADGDWDLRPHAARVIPIDDAALAAFAAAEGLRYDLDDPPRPMRLYVDLELDLLERIGAIPGRVGGRAPQFSSGIHESSMARPGAGQLVEKRVGTPTSIDTLVLKGPNINVANPCYQEANPEYRHSKDNSIIDLGAIADSFLPRTVLQTAVDPAVIRDRLAKKDGWDSVGAWRLLWPEHVSRGWVRMFQPAIISPGVLHGHSCMSAAFASSQELVRVAGLASSVIYESLLRMLGTDHLGELEISGLPFPQAGQRDYLWPAIEVRAARLNAVTQSYAPLWADTYCAAWRDDAPTIDDSRLPDYSVLNRTWSAEMPIRNEMGRWCTLIELDALAALILGLPESLVETVAALHLGLLTRYDRSSRFDVSGQKLSGEFHNRGAAQDSTAQYASALAARSSQTPLSSVPELARYSLPLTELDRWSLFRNAYSTFAKRYDVDDSVSQERVA